MRKEFSIKVVCWNGIVEGSVWAENQAEAEQKARAVFKYTIYRLGGELFPNVAPMAW